MREKRLPQAYEEAGDEEEEPTKRPRTRFVELQPTANDPADAVSCPALPALPTPLLPLHNS